MNDYKTIPKPPGAFLLTTSAKTNQQKYQRITDTHPKLILFACVCLAVTIGVLIGISLVGAATVAASAFSPVPIFSLQGLYLCLTFTCMAAIPIGNKVWTKINDRSRGTNSAQQSSKAIPIGKKVWTKINDRSRRTNSAQQSSKALSPITNLTRIPEEADPFSPRVSSIAIADPFSPRVSSIAIADPFSPRVSSIAITDPFSPRVSSIAIADPFSPRVS